MHPPNPRSHSRTRPCLTALGVLMLWLMIPIGHPAFAAEAPRVVASIRPIHALVAGVMAGVGEPELLVRGAGSPHDHALRPSEARLLSNARLLVWVGPGLEPFLAKGRTLLPGNARSLVLMEAHSILHRPNRPPGVWATEPPEPDADPANPYGGEGGKDGHKELGGDDHGHGRDNPHLWLDPVNARIAVGAIAEALTEIDPGNRKAYTRNALRMGARIAHLELELTPRLKRMRGLPFVVTHDAFAHFEGRFGLWGLGALTAGAGQAGGARRMTALRQALSGARERAGVACVFSEPQTNPRLADLAAEGTGARQTVLDPLGTGHPPGEDLYFALMRELADTLIACLTP